MTSAVVIRALDEAEVGQVIDWAAAEGWNPGLDDLVPFRSVDRDGFLGLFLDGALASTISAAAYDASFGFIGFYICRPEHRGKGFGKRIWDAALLRLGGRTIGLDGVVAQQANYAREGFELARRNIRYSGLARGHAPADSALLEIGAASPPALLDEIVAYDARFFPTQRAAFVRSWIDPEKRRTAAYVTGGRLRGYGVIRAGRSGWKVGPLFADDGKIAEMLFAALASPHSGAPVTLDVPEVNAAARDLAERHGLAPVFETARMYRGTAPRLPLEGIFGITSFELG